MIQELSMTNGFEMFEMRQNVDAKNTFPKVHEDEYKPLYQLKGVVLRSAPPKMPVKLTSPLSQDTTISSPEVPLL